MGDKMDAEKQNSNSSSSSTPDVLPLENHDDSLIHHTSPLGTIIPNRIFVGGIDYKANESELRHFFSQHGVVKEVKIVIDHSGMSKGYGFVTFETQEEALRILHDANGICFKDKKLSIGQAVRKHQALRQIKNIPGTNPNPSMPLPMSCGTLYLTTSTGYPYTYHNGVAYFYNPNMNPPAHHWPPAPPATHSQPVNQPPAYHHYQCVQNQCRLNVMQFAEAPVQQVYPVYPQRTEGMTPIGLQQEPGKNLMFTHSWIHLKPTCCPHIHHMDSHYLQDTAELPDPLMLPTSQPLM